MNSISLRFSPKHDSYFLKMDAVEIEVCSKCFLHLLLSVYKRHPYLIQQSLGVEGSLRELSLFEKVQNVESQVYKIQFARTRVSFLRHELIYLLAQVWTVSPNLLSVVFQASGDFAQAGEVYA